MKANVLVTAAGSIVAQGIIKSLKLANDKNNSSHRGDGIHYNIISADMNPMAAGLYRSHSGIIIPPSTSPDYIDAVARACQKMRVDAVFCGSDDELFILANGRRQIHEEAGAEVMVGDDRALSIARDKWKTYEYCIANRLPCAPSCMPEDSDGLVHEYGFPVIVKPRQGYGSLHTYLVSDQAGLNHAISSITRVGWHPIVQKYIPGDLEFTSGVTIDRTARYVMSSISMRKILKNGQTHKAFIDDYQSVRKSAEEASLKLGTFGAVNVQAKIGKEGEMPQIFEINPRFSATCPMRAVAGINEPDIVFRNSVMGEDIKVSSYDRLFCARYHNEVYVPLRAYEQAVKAQPDSDFIIKDTGSFIADYF
ncbi:MAG TPA: ATP-grasp domain-containing protein [Nitrososphaera sp.]|nr:ATP-grasp domain-containing protein [Nitrososphaera sp.]